MTPEPIAKPENPRLPLVVWTILALNVLIYLWDRNWNPFGSSATFSDLVMHPNEVVGATRHLGFPLATVFTSMFLHGGLTHLLGNLVFLYVFGPGVEEAIGGVRLALYYVAWGVAAAAAQIWVDPYTSVPTLGASGAIGGVLGAYFLLFPSSRIEVLIPFLRVRGTRLAPPRRLVPLPGLLPPGGRGELGPRGRLPRGDGDDPRPRRSVVGPQGPTGAAGVLSLAWVPLMPYSSAARGGPRWKPRTTSTRPPTDRPPSPKPRSRP